MAYNYKMILCDVHDQIGRIILNQPEKRNPLNYYRLAEVAAAAKEMERDDNVKVIIIKGAGPCFSAGYDLTPGKQGKGTLHPETGVYINPDRDQVWGTYNKHHLSVYFTLWDLQKPVIAQIHSYCLAGATELSAFCDMRIVSDDAVIGWPVSRALSPGNIQYAPWMIGITKAKEMYFTGDSMDAQEAWRVGWATRVYPRAQLEEETEKFAQRMTLIETDLIMMTKRGINRQMEMMGFRTGVESWSTDFLSLAGFRKSAGEFSKVAEEMGLKAALDWRDSKFGDLRTSEKAKKARGAK
ncbi:MAG: Enoyl-CoA hydratase/isomerase [Dehalococcoidales bacterium]|nr:Enoyl-CoA hydratase/isomerase [Dehalococcoidales bacterium]